MTPLSLLYLGTFFKLCSGQGYRPIFVDRSSRTTQTIDELQTISIIECASHCASTPPCSAFQFTKSTTSCTRIDSADLIGVELPSLGDKVHLLVQKTPVNGQWSTWTSSRPCSVSCGGGIEAFKRACDDPALKNGGLDCDRTGHNETKQEPCNTHPCPIHGAWTTWTAWSSCSVTCGPGRETRNKTCTNPEPQHGGDSCPGNSTEEQDCNLALCKGGVMHFEAHWGDWGGVRYCTVDEGYATSFGIRAKENGGDDLGMTHLKLQCSGGTDIYSMGSSTKGTWRPDSSTCTEGFSGARVNILEDKGWSSDDSSTNCIELYCIGTASYISGNCFTQTGDWYTKNCPSGERICGLMTRLEEGGSTDETGLNDVKLFCCTIY